MAFFHLAFFSMTFLVIAFLPNRLFTNKKFRKYFIQRYDEIVTMEVLYEISEDFSDFSCQLGIHKASYREGPPWYTYQSYEIKLPSQTFLDGRKLRQVGRVLFVAKFSCALICSCLLFTNLNFATS